MATLLAVLMIAQRSRETTEAALATEQANARRDQLTGAPNRRAFEEAMTSEHARVVRGASAGRAVRRRPRPLQVGQRPLRPSRRRRGADRGRPPTHRGPASLRRRRTLGWRGVHGAHPGRPGTSPAGAGRRADPHCSSATSRSPRRRRPCRSPVSVGGTLLDGSVPPATAFERADRALYEAKPTRDTSAIALPPRLTLRLETA